MIVRRSGGCLCLVGLLLLGAPSVRKAAAEEDIDIPFVNGRGGGSSQCPKFSCDAGMEPAPVRPMKLAGSGCSNFGGMSMTSGTGGAGQEALAACCNQRQACFQVCGASKAQCERTFKQCTKKTCSDIRKANTEEGTDCERTANLQNIMSGLADCREYSSAQAAGCTCMSPDKARERREKVLTDVYKKVNKSKVNKVQELMEKVGTSVSKFAGLILQLMSKYPKIVKYTKDPQQEALERLMKQAREGKIDEEYKVSSDDAHAALFSGGPEAEAEEIDLDQEL